nr:MAG TPA: hypothetical protein [Caudoviricetes sp.]
MTISHKLVITLPDEATIDAEEGTVTMELEQARQWAQSVLEATGERRNPFGFWEVKKPDTRGDAHEWRC